MVVSRPYDAAHAARLRFESGTHDYHNLCLRAVREYLGIGSHYYTAQDAWDGLRDSERHEVHHEDRMPFGAPVWSKGSNSAGHIFLAGGRFKSGRRIFWTTDQHSDGRVTPVTLDFFTDYWGHRILGWGESLNTVTIPYLKDR